MPTLPREFKRELLNLIPEEIYNNPYRILGIDVNSSPTQIRRVCEDMLAALNINHPVQRDDYLPFLQKQELLKENIEKARRNLQDNMQTTISSFFFLAFNYPHEKQVRFELQQESLDEAINILKQATGETVGKENQNAMHDYGLLVFILAIIEPDTDTAYSFYKQSIGNLIASSRTLIVNNDYNEKIINIIITTIAKRIQLFLDNNDYNSACKFLNLMNELPLDKENYIHIAGRPFQQLFNRITKYCQHIKTDVNKINDKSPRETLEKLIIKFKKEILSPVQTISDSSNTNICEFQTLCEETIDCGSSITIKLHNIYDESQSAQSLLETLIKLPASEAKINSIKNDLLIITKHANIDIAKQHINDGNWIDAEIFLMLALNQTTDNEESKYINDKLQMCKRAKAFLAVKQKEPEISTIWDGFIGFQIKRCLKNELWMNIIILILSTVLIFPVIIDINHNQLNDTNLFFIVSLILICILIINNLYSIFRQYNNFTLHHISQQLSKYGPLEWVIHNIQSDLGSSFIIGDINKPVSILSDQSWSLFEIVEHRPIRAIITPLWFIYPSFLRIHIIPSTKIIWCYKIFTRHFYNGNFSHTTSLIKIKITDNKTISIDYGFDINAYKDGDRDKVTNKLIMDMKKNQKYIDSNDIYKKIEKIYPWIIIGFSKEIEEQWYYKQKSLLVDVNNCRQSLVPFIDYAYPHVIAKEKKSVLLPNGKKMKTFDFIQMKIIPILITSTGLLYLILLFLGYTFIYQSSNQNKSNSSVNNETSNYIPTPQSNIIDTPVVETPKFVAPPSGTKIINKPGYTYHGIEKPDPESVTMDPESRLQSEIDIADANLTSMQDSINNKKQSLDNIDYQITSYESDIAYLKSQSNNGGYIDIDDYNLKVREHNSLVKKYNSTKKKYNRMVDSYNSLLKKRNQKVIKLKQLRGEY